MEIENVESTKKKSRKGLSDLAFFGIMIGVEVAVVIFVAIALNNANQNEVIGTELTNREFITATKQETTIMEQDYAKAIYPELKQNLAQAVQEATGKQVSKSAIYLWQSNEQRLTSGKYAGMQFVVRLPSGYRLFEVEGDWVPKVSQALQNGSLDSIDILPKDVVSKSFRVEKNSILSS